MEHLLDGSVLTLDLMNLAFDDNNDAWSNLFSMNDDALQAELAAALEGFSMTDHEREDIASVIRSKETTPVETPAR
jgi:hypothetical protein